MPWLVQVWSAGGNASGSSQLAVVTSIASGELACRYVSGVPQAPQKLRVTGGEEWNSTGPPRVNAKRATGTVIHATTGAPAARRQVPQWQNVASLTSPLAR